MSELPTLFVPILVDREGAPVPSVVEGKPIDAAPFWDDKEGAEAQAASMNIGRGAGPNSYGWHWVVVEFAPVPF